jgi:hypothetical protein
MVCLDMLSATSNALQLFRNTSPEAEQTRQSVSMCYHQKHFSTHLKVNRTIRTPHETNKSDFKFRPTNPKPLPPLQPIQTPCHKCSIAVSTQKLCYQTSPSIHRHCKYSNHNPPQPQKQTLTKLLTQHHHTDLHSYTAEKLVVLKNKPVTISSSSSRRIRNDKLETPRTPTLH